MYAWLMHLMSKLFGRTAKKNMEKMETENNAEEDEEEEEAAEDSSDDDDEGGGGEYEDNIHSSAQGGFG